MGFVLTAVALIVIWVVRDYVSLSLSITFVFVVLAVYEGGLWWGLAAAGLVIAVEAWLLWPIGQYGRFALVTITLLATVYLVAILQRRAYLFETANDISTELKEIMRGLQSTCEDFEQYTRPQLYERIKRSTDNMVDLTTKAMIWHALSEEIKDVKREYKIDADESC